MSLETVFGTYRNRPELSVVAERGSVPAAKGDPGIGVRAPEPGSTVNAETLLAKRLGTKANFPERATARGPRSVAKGEPATSVNLPLAGSTRYAETLLESRLAA